MLSNHTLRIAAAVLTGLVVMLATALFVVLRDEDAPAPEKQEKETFTVTGTVGGSNCGGEVVQAQLEFRDEEGTLVGTGRTGGDIDTNPQNCYSEFTATVERADFYQVSLGNLNLGSVSFADLEAQGWEMRLTI